MTEKKRPGRPPNPHENEIVETIRGLLRLNQTKGDIARMVIANKNFGLESTKSVGKYIALARKRNREAIGRTSDDALADSLSLWSSRQREAMQAAGKARKSIEYHEARIRECEKTIDAPNSTEEKVEIALIQQQRSVQQMDDARRTIFTSEKTIVECQDRIDKLLGNFAPLKIAKTDTKGRDVVDPVQPTTKEAAAENVAGLLETLKSRITNEGN